MYKNSNYIELTKLARRLLYQCERSIFKQCVTTGFSKLRFEFCKPVI